jgi:ribosomal protein S18 acetylase RimI-like enzyme
MLHWLETTALTAGTFVITLEVRASNPVARAFYTACEYREVGTVEGYYQGRDSAIKMSRDLRVNCPRNEHPP